MTRRLHMYEMPDVCGPCGGRCCKGIPGIYSPEDFGAPNVEAMRDAIVKALASGRVVIDWWEDEGPEQPLTFYLRPAIAGLEEWMRHAAWNGSHCTFLTPSGCELSHDERPFQCRALEPEPDVEKRRKEGCKAHGGSKWDAAEPWIAYQDVIEAAAKMAAEMKGASNADR